MMKKQAFMMAVWGIGLGLVALTMLMGQTAVVQAKEGVTSTSQTKAAGGELPVCTGENLLENPGFEGEYTAYIFPEPGHPDCQGENNTFCERAQMPAGWHPRWLPDGTEEWIIMPEYTASTTDQVNPERVLSGEKSLHYFSFFTRHESAVHQQIAVTPGVTYCFSVWGHAWSDRLDDDFYSATPDRPEDDGDLFQKAGIDPTGGTDYTASAVTWTAERKQYDEFGLFSLEITAQAPTMTVFIYSRADKPVKHNDVYWDQATFTRVSETMTVQPANGLAWIVPISPAVQLTQSVEISLTGGLTWTALLAPGNFTPTLNTTAGSAGESLGVTVDTTGLITGTYTATLTITASMTDTVNSPAVLPIKLFVVTEVHRSYLPLITRP